VYTIVSLPERKIYPQLASGAEAPGEHCAAARVGLTRAPVQRPATPTKAAPSATARLLQDGPRMRASSSDIASCNAY
jgi:hypothetical protein